MNTLLEKIAVNVTSEQIGKAHKVWDYQNHEDFFLVENSKGDTDDNGDIIEYKVRYDSIKGFTCTCEAGMHGFYNCKNYCWHVRASCALELEMRNAFAEMALTDQPRTVHPRELPAVTAPIIVESTPCQAVMNIEDRWNIPAWMLNTPVARHMKNSPKELN